VLFYSTIDNSFTLEGKGIKGNANQARISDYNNPAKTLRTVSPKLEPPSKRNLACYTMYLPGSNLNTIKRMFEATPQLGTRGAVQGINLRDRILSPNPILNDVATDTSHRRQLDSSSVLYSWAAVALSQPPTHGAL
jgi:hypothetical protein